MFIFNIPAIPVVLVIALIVAPLFWAFPAFMERPHGNLVIGLVGVTVGGAAEAFGFKGRLFFLPVWLIGLLVMGYGAWQLWGWWGAGAGASAVVVALGGLVLYAAYADKRDWERAPSALIEAAAAFGAGNTEEAWKSLDRAFFVPSIRRLSTEICMHNIDVIDVIIGQLEGNTQPVNISLLRRVQAQFAEAANEEDPEMKDELVNFVRDLIANKGELDVPETEARAARAA